MLIIQQYLSSSTFGQILYAIKANDTTFYVYAHVAGWYGVKDTEKTAVHQLSLFIKANCTFYSVVSYHCSSHACKSSQYTFVVKNISESKKDMFMMNSKKASLQKSFALGCEATVNFLTVSSILYLVCMICQWIDIS